MKTKFQAWTILTISSLALVACGSIQFINFRSINDADGVNDSALTSGQSLDADRGLNSAQAYAIGTSAVVYGLPLVMMDLTRRIATNVVTPAGRQAPINQFAHAQHLSTPDGQPFIRPNVDTLYSLAWFDLTAEPLILSVPKMDFVAGQTSTPRYYVMELFDMWTNVIFSIGSRTTGSEAGRFAIIGPNWKGTIPTGLQVIKSPSVTAWVIGRLSTNGTNDDITKIKTLQAGMKIVPLSYFASGQAYTPPTGTVDGTIDMSTPVFDQVKTMTSEAFLTTLANLMKRYPPPPADAAELDLLAKIGLVPGQDFSFAQLPRSIANALQNVLPAGINASYAGLATFSLVNGWAYPPSDTGLFGTHYAERAIAAIDGIGANIRRDAVYPSTSFDDRLRPLSSEHSYLIHFNPPPPEKGFWSVTIYNDQGYLFPNSENRYSVSSWMPGLKYNLDGSIDVMIQQQSPGSDWQNNWLPSASSSSSSLTFNLVLRIYWPGDQVLNGTWRAPGVQRVKE